MYPGGAGGRVWRWWSSGNTGPGPSGEPELT